MSELQRVLTVALRHLDDQRTSAEEREAVLVLCVKHLSGDIGEAAARSLHHFREQKKEERKLAAMSAREERHRRSACIDRIVRNFDLKNNGGDV